MKKTRTKVDFTKSGKPVTHGIASSYNNHKCGCPECREAWRVYISDGGYVKRYRKNKKQETKGVKIKL